MRLRFLAATRYGAVMQDGAETAALVSLLAWYREMGADAAITDRPIDWIAEGDRAPGAGWAPADRADTPRAAASELPPPTVAPSRAPLPPRPSPPEPVRTAPPRQLPTSSPDAAETEARKLARRAADLQGLEQILRAFDGCALKATAKNLCFFRGAARARIMVIGEAPGREEDLEGRPFVGRAGQLLDRMLIAAGFSETDVHITNIVYWRPPGNRTPTPQEAQICKPFLERQMELVEPAFVVLCGGAAAKHVLDTADGIMKIRGKWRTIEIAGRQVRALPTLHPAYLLRTPAHKRQAWRDLLALRAAVDGEI